MAQGSVENRTETDHIGSVDRGWSIGLLGPFPAAAAGWLSVRAACVGERLRCVRTIPCLLLGCERTPARCPLTVNPVQDSPDHRSSGEQTGNRSPGNIGIEDLRQVPNNATQENVAQQDAQCAARLAARCE